MHEKLDLIEITLEIVQRVTVRVDALYSGPGDAAKKIFVRLLNLCSALDSWLDVDIIVEDDIPTPARIREKALTVGIDILRYLGGTTTGGGSHVLSWRILRSILIECLDVGQGEYQCVLRSGSCSLYPEFVSLPGLFSAPFTVILFSKPRIQEASANDVFEVSVDYQLLRLCGLTQ